MPIRHAICNRRRMNGKKPKIGNRMGPFKVLVVEDQPEIVDYCNRYISDGFVYDRLKSGKQVDVALNSKEYDLVLLDKNFSHNSPDELLGPPHQAVNEGIEILKKIKSIDINLPVIIITGFGDRESVSTAFRLGAFDYAEAEIMTEDEMILRRKMENAILGFSARSRELVEKYNRAGLIGKSPVMVEIYRKIEEALKTDCTVLILGETGTGKDVLAGILHKMSNRSSGPFIRCDMTQNDLIESSLFGHLKGSFTDAKSDRKGFFELADGGVILLNEIGELSLDNQKKLLIALEDKEIYPKGSEKPIIINARVISATNKNLLKAIEDEEFRRDLYVRLNKMRIIMPSLRQRPEDIPLLVRHFIDSYCQQQSISSLEITYNAMEYLQARDWPGNVRELKDAVERIVELSDSIVSIKEVVSFDKYQFVQLDPPSLEKTETSYADKTLEQVEREMIIYYLNKYNGYIKPAHEAIGISRGTIYSRIAQYNLTELTNGYSSPK
jgi:DNA-binding NtrC family response regulator